MCAIPYFVQDPAMYKVKDTYGLKLGNVTGPSMDKASKFVSLCLNDSSSTGTRDSCTTGGKQDESTRQAVYIKNFAFAMIGIGMVNHLEFFGIF